jgi:hypothetical protein
MKSADSTLSKICWRRNTAAAKEISFARLQSYFKSYFKNFIRWSALPVSILVNPIPVFPQTSLPPQAAYPVSAIPEKPKIQPGKLNESRVTVEETAVEQISRLSLDSLLKRRADKLSEQARRRYDQELRQRPELRGVKVLADDDARLQALNKNLAPLLRLYERDDYTKSFVYESDNPFVGLYRECIIIFSTKALDLLTPEQQRAAAAHELAHEVFIGEMRAADSADDNKQRHLVELECDLVAVLATSRFGDDPFAVVRADEAFANWYRKNPPAFDLEIEKSPSAAVRARGIELFLAARHFHY